MPFSEVDEMRTGNIFADITQIIEECEEVQHSNESDYTKDRAKIHAYDEIIEVLREVVKE